MGHKSEWLSRFVGGGSTHNYSSTSATSSTHSHVTASDRRIHDGCDQNGGYDQQQRGGRRSLPRVSSAPGYVSVNGASAGTAGQVGQYQMGSEPLLPAGNDGRNWNEHVVSYGTRHNTSHYSPTAIPQYGAGYYPPPRDLSQGYSQNPSSVGRDWDQGGFDDDDYYYADSPTAHNADTSQTPWDATASAQFSSYPSTTNLGGHNSPTAPRFIVGQPTSGYHQRQPAMQEEDFEERYVQLGACQDYHLYQSQGTNHAGHHHRRHH